MQTIEHIRKILSEHKQELAADFKVKEIGVFGSYVRNEQKEDSDVDVLVEFYDPVDFFKFIALENHLSYLLHSKVDLVTKNALKPIIKDKILRDTVYV